jgi:hypothetical protein
MCSHTVPATGTWGAAAPRSCQDGCNEDQRIVEYLHLLDLKNLCSNTVRTTGTRGAAAHRSSRENCNEGSKNIHIPLAGTGNAVFKHRACVPTTGNRGAAAPRGSQETAMNVVHIFEYLHLLELETGVHTLCQQWGLGGR